MNAENRKELTLPAKIELLDTVLDFICAQLEANGCSVETQMLIAIAAEEIYVNIAHYAYPAGIGDAFIQFTIDHNTRIATIRFADSGTPYDPLQRTDPDLTLDAQSRSIGGLGIYMVKESMDRVEYEYKDGKNMLTIEKTI